MLIYNPNTFFYDGSHLSKFEDSISMRTRSVTWFKKVCFWKTFTTSCDTSLLWGLQKQF